MIFTDIKELRLSFFPFDEILQFFVCKQDDKKIIILPNIIDQCLIMYRFLP